VDTILIVVVTAAWFVLPGVGLAWRIAPATPPGLPRLAVVLGVGLAATSIAMTVLALLGLLRPLPIVLAICAITLVPLLPIGRRGGPVSPAAWLGWRDPRGRDATRLGPAIVTAIGLLVLVAVFLIPSHRQLDNAPLPISTTVWYYARLAEATGSAGAFPDTIGEWGEERPFQTDYAPFTAQSAALFSLVPDDLPGRLEAYRLAVLVAVFLLGILLLRRWFSTWIALIGAVLLLGTIRIDERVLAYRPETFALALALFGLWLIDRAAVERRPGILLAAALVAALVFLSHAEVFVVMLPAAAGIALARGPLRLDPAGRRRIARIDPGRLPAGLAVIAAVGAGAAGGVLANGVIAGEFRLAAYVAGSSPVDVPAVPPERLPDGWTLSADPTWNFFVAATGPERRVPPASFTDPRLLPRSSVHVWGPVNGNTPPGLAALVAITAGPLLFWAALDGRRRRAMATWLVFGPGLIAGSFLLFAISDTYVPQRVGGRRLVPYEVLVPVMTTTVLAWLAHRVVFPRPSRRRAWPAAVAVPIVTLAVAVTLALWPSQGGEEDVPGLTPGGYAALGWIRENLPPGSRILANAYTDGSIGMLSGGIGVIDGRASYLEDPAFLGESTSLLLGARRFFQAPADPGAAAFLDDEAVEYLLVIAPGGSSSLVAGYRPFPTDVDALRSGRYTLVESFEGDRLMLFQVDGPPVSSIPAARRARSGGA
jgi:hypothetical protein